ncbi:MAG: fibronectin type III domain-containing protein, partial [Methanomassiliicoccales archaeon]|nr:fibronectin type III domain-containing protein [Methanomassiliicoccales archaeon]
IGLIDNSGMVDGRVSLAVDSENIVHVVYYRGGELMHANQMPTGWATESLESTDQLGGGISMFIDDQDQIYVTFYNEVLSLLKYINNVGGQWNPAEVIEAEGNVGIGSSIMVDDNGDEHIAYVEKTTTGVLKYVEKRNGIWMFQKVDLQGCGDHISMAMDFQGRAHISYYDSVSKDLRYASSVVVPSAPLNLTTTVSDGAVTLHWEAPASNGGANITEYAIYRGTSTDDLILYDDVSGVANSYTDLGLENGVSWTYRIRAVNSEGSSLYSNQVVGTPCTLPGAPEVDASGRDKAVLLDWNAPDNGGAAIIEYKIYRQNETGFFVLIATVGGGETKYTDTGLENDVEYTYQVSAVNPAGEGQWSEKASATANPNNDMIMIIAFVIVIAAVAGAGVFLLMRRKGKI